MAELGARRRPRAGGLSRLDMHPGFNRGPWSADQGELKAETEAGWRDVPCTPVTRVEFRLPLGQPWPCELWIDGTLVGTLLPATEVDRGWIADALMSYGKGQHHG